MIKMVNLVSLLIAPLLAQMAAAGRSRAIGYVVSIVCLVALAVGILFSKREPRAMD
jgi:hypothetical protein